MLLPLQSILRQPKARPSWLRPGALIGGCLAAAAALAAAVLSFAGGQSASLPPSPAQTLSLSVALALALAAASAAWLRARQSDARSREAEARQRDDEQRLNEIAAASSDWLWETDPEHRFRYVSGRIEELSNLRQPDFLGKTRIEMGMKTEDPTEAARFLDDLAARRPFRDFIYYIGASPHRHYFRISGRPIFAADGSFNGYLGTGSDVTAQQHAKELAERSRAQLLEAIESISEGFALFDADDRLVLINEMAREIMDAGDLLQPGVSFAELARHVAQSGRIPDAVGREEEWVGQRLAQRSRAAGVSEQQVGNGRWISVNERRTRDGGTVMIYSDITEAKKREALLRESKAQAAKLRNQLVDAIESISEGFVLYDSENRLVLCNRHYSQMYPGAANAIRPGALRTDIIDAIAAAGDVKEVTSLDQRLRHHFANPGSPRPSFERQLADGRWIRVSESRTQDGGLVGIRTDITELKRHAAELSHQSALLRTTFENMAHGISIIDRDLKLVGYNRLFVEMFGFPSELLENPNLTLTDIFRYNAVCGQYGPGDVEAQVLERVERAKRFRPHRYEHARPDGAIIEVRGDPLPGGGFVTIYTDITERRRAEAALRASEDRYRQLVDVSPDAVVVHRDGVIEFANRTATTLFGLAAATDLIGCHVLEFTHPDFHASVRERIQAMMVKGATTPAVETRLLRRDGSGFEAELSAAVFGNPDERAILTVIRDISERRRVEVELRAAMEQAEAANRSKTEFLANMSHELRTPLNAVIGFSEIIAGQLFGPLGSERYIEYAEDIRDSGQHLLSLINDILDLSKAEAGKLELHESTLDTASAVDSCLRLVRDRADRSGVKLISRVAASHKIRCDARMLKQILLNLLSNAIKFTPQGGQVTIRTENDASGALLLQIIDTGIGMAKEDIPRALQAFTQVDSALSRKYDGTGLGLPLTKTMVELHGGELLIDSTVGLGTTVTVRLPPGRLVQ